MAEAQRFPHLNSDRKKLPMASHFSSPSLSATEERNCETRRPKNVPFTSTPRPRRPRSPKKRGGAERSSSYRTSESRFGDRCGDLQTAPRRPGQLVDSPLRGSAAAVSQRRYIAEYPDGREGGNSPACVYCFPNHCNLHNCMQSRLSGSQRRQYISQLLAKNLE